MTRMSRIIRNERSKQQKISHLHRFFVRPECVEGGRVRLDGLEARQICSVLRLGRGDQFAALDGSGRALIVRISEAGPASVLGEVLEACPVDTEPRVRVTLLQSLPKGDKLEFILQKGTELGVARFEIVTTARTVARPPEDRLAPRLERWRAIAKEAAEQSCRAIVPQVSGVLPLAEFLPRLAEFDLALCLWEGEQRQGIGEILSRNRSGENVLVMIGPEGGFEEDEVRMMQAGGAHAVSLGRRILRCETAAIAAAAIVVYEMDVEASIP